MQTLQTQRVTKTRRGRAKLERRGFGVPEIAASYGVSEQFIRLLIARNKLKAFRLGRRVLVTPESLAYLENQNADG